MSLTRKAFRRLHYPVDVIAQCVRWYLTYALSLRNLEEMMAERGITVDHSTVYRWVIRLTPVSRSQTILAGIELMHMLRKGQYQHPRGDGMSPAEQFYLLAA